MRLKKFRWSPQAFVGPRLGSMKFQNLTLLGLLALSFLLIGCAAELRSSFRENRPAPTGIAPQDTVAVALSDFSGKFSIAKEEEFGGCVTETLRSAYPTLKLVSPDEFRRVAFPDLTQEAVPLERWDQLLADRRSREQIVQVGIRYLVLVGGGTEQKAGHDFAGGPAFGIEFDRRSRLHAVLWDFVQDREAGKVAIEVSGNPGVLIIFPFIPIVMPAFTETQACKDLGTAVVKFLTGERPAEQQEPEQPGDPPDRVDK